MQYTAASRPDLMLIWDSTILWRERTALGPYHSLGDNTQLATKNSQQDCVISELKKKPP